MYTIMFMSILYRTAYLIFLMNHLKNASEKKIKKSSLTGEGPLEFCPCDKRQN